MNICKKASKVLPFMALAAAFLTSCSSDNLADSSQQTSNSEEKKTVTFTATVAEENSDTRMGMDKIDIYNAQFYWHKGDAIAVQIHQGVTYGQAIFTTTDSDGTTDAKFAGYVTQPNTLDGYAKFPVDGGSFSSADKVSYNLPGTYTYDKVESNIFPKKVDGTITYPVNKTNMPMLGKSDNKSWTQDDTHYNGNIAFRHVAGMAIIRVEKMPVTAGTLTVTSDCQLAGTFEINGFRYSTNPVIETTKEVGGNGYKNVTFKFTNATKDAVGVFYLPMATGDYENVKIAISDENGGSTTTCTQLDKLTITRANVTVVPVTNTRVINGHKFVDLGLSVLWAETNIGAETASEYGNYYAWGETSTKDSYDWSNYAHGKSESEMTKYDTSDKNTLETTDDAAYTLWSSSCRMPTKEEFDELAKEENCKWEWVMVNGVNGYKVTSLKEGYTDNSIFLPAAGCRTSTDKVDRGSAGFYYSSSLYWTGAGSKNASSVYFNNSVKNTWPNLPYSSGCTIRPVAGK